MIVDINVNLSRWPGRRLPFDETPQLVAKLKRNGIVQALAGSFDGLLHKDIADVNSRLADDCRQHGEGLLIPVGSINPMLPDWQEDIRRCQQVHAMPAIRLNPNYHGYTLADPVFAELLTAAEAHNLTVLIALKMEDVRTHHPLMQVDTVDAAPLPDLVEGREKLRVVIINDYRSVRGNVLARLVKSENVFFDIAHAEQVGALEKLIKDIPYERLLFGSHFPFFYLEAALLKFRESELGQFVTEAIQYKNAQQLFGLSISP